MLSSQIAIQVLIPQRAGLWLLDVSPHLCFYVITLPVFCVVLPSVNPSLWLVVLAIIALVRTCRFGGFRVSTLLFETIDAINLKTVVRVPILPVFIPKDDPPAARAAFEVVKCQLNRLVGGMIFHGGSPRLSYSPRTPQTSRRAFPYIIPDLAGLFS